MSSEPMHEIPRRFKLPMLDVVEEDQDFGIQANPD